MVDLENSHDDANEEVMALSGTGLEVTEDTRDRWITGYQQDPKLHTALRELRLGKPYGQMQLNSLGLLVTNDGEQKLVVPQSMRQEVLRECHDTCSVKHRGWFVSLIMGIWEV